MSIVVHGLEISTSAEFYAAFEDAFEGRNYARLTKRLPDLLKVFEQGDRSLCSFFLSLLVRKAQFFVTHSWMHANNGRLPGQSINEASYAKAKETVFDVLGQALDRAPEELFTESIGNDILRMAVAANVWTDQSGTQFHPENHPLADNVVSRFARRAPQEWVTRELWKLVSFPLHFNLPTPSEAKERARFVDVTKALIVGLKDNVATLPETSFRKLDALSSWFRQFSPNAAQTEAVIQDIRTSISSRGLSKGPEKSEGKKKKVGSHFRLERK